MIGIVTLDKYSYHLKVLWNVKVYLNYKKDELQELNEIQF